MQNRFVTLLSNKGLLSKVSGHTLWVCCPFCILRGKTPDEKYRLGIEIQGGRVPWGMGHCFHCGYKSPHTLQRLLKINTQDLKNIDDTQQHEEYVRPELPSDFQLLHGWDKYDDWVQLAWSYLRKRSVSPDQIRRHRVGLSLIGRARGRIVFPIYGRKQLQGYTARTLINREPKWLHSKGLHSPFWASRKDREEIIVTEGVFDALAVERVLGDRTDILALLGSSLTEERFAKIKQYSRVTLWLDSDQAGRKGTINLGSRLEENREQKILNVQGLGHDPGSMDDEEIRESYENRVEWSEEVGLHLLIEGLK